MPYTLMRYALSTTVLALYLYMGCLGVRIGLDALHTNAIFTTNTSGNITVFTTDTTYTNTVFTTNRHYTARQMYCLWP